METFLSYGSDAKESQLSSELWYLDNGDMIEKDPFTEDEDANAGFITQGKFTSTSKSVQMMERLHCDLFQQDRYLLSKVEMIIRLICSPETFHLMGGGSAFTTITEDAALFIRKVILMPPILLNIIKFSAKGNMPNIQ